MLLDHYQILNLFYHFIKARQSIYIKGTTFQI